MRTSPVVVIIDDDELVRQTVAHLISSEGYRTEVYASAEDFCSATIMMAAYRQLNWPNRAVVE
jgi:FixJ family two-component response regulator